MFSSRVVAAQQYEACGYSTGLTNCGQPVASVALVTVAFYTNRLGDESCNVSRFSDFDWFDPPFWRGYRLIRFPRPPQMSRALVCRQEVVLAGLVVGTLPWPHFF